MQLFSSENWVVCTNAASLFGITGEEIEERLKLEKDKKDADEKYRCKQRKIKELQENLQVKSK